MNKSLFTLALAAAAMNINAQLVVDSKNSTFFHQTEIKS